MYGVNLRVLYDGFGVNLRPFAKEDVSELVAHWNSMKVHMFTNGLFGQTLENELEWYDRIRKENDSCHWAVVPDGSDVAVGVTGIHHIDTFGSCGTGIVIWDQKWWHKGVASRAHLGRTLFAADYLNRLTIKSSVRTDNPASLKALLKVGYLITGTEPRTTYRSGKFLDTHLFCWIHPEKVNALFPEGLPSQLKEGVERAQKALCKAREVVSFP